MLHEPAANVGKDPAFAYKRRLGVILFFIYAAVYAAFVIINIADASLMEAILFGGLNIAVVYGFGLIILALISRPGIQRRVRQREASMAVSKGREVDGDPPLRALHFSWGCPRPFSILRAGQSRPAAIPGAHPHPPGRQRDSVCGRLPLRCILPGDVRPDGTAAYHGFLLIGYLVGWIVALFVVAEPLKRLGNYILTDGWTRSSTTGGLSSPRP